MKNDNDNAAPNWALGLPQGQKDKVEEWYHAGFNPHDYISFGGMADAVIAWIDETLQNN